MPPTASSAAAPAAAGTTTAPLALLLLLLLLLVLVLLLLVHVKERGEVQAAEERLVAARLGQVVRRGERRARRRRHKQACRRGHGDTTPTAQQAARLSTQLVRGRACRHLRKVGESTRRGGKGGEGVAHLRAAR